MKKYKVSAPFIILPVIDVPASNEEEALINYNLVVKEILNRSLGEVDILPYQDDEDSIQITLIDD